ncbi:MAG: relaxase/mobilization nuclease domain-containing protein [Bacteroidetes bacterium]|nr:MAG: relaxase/mobilization nuclease domain-containing protein [Bacteroidota bacterium]
MIIKSLSRKTPSYRQLINYVLHENEKPAPDGLERFVYTKNLTGHTVDEWVQSFETQESYRLYQRSNQNYLYHVIISWHISDRQNITTAMLKDIAREFAKRRGISLYVATPHFLQNAVHLHVVHSSLELLTGRSLRISKGEFAKLKRDLEAIQLERYPEITHSVVDHDKNNKVRIHDNEYHLKARTGTTDKEILTHAIEQALTISASPDDLKQLLQEQGITVYERNGRLQGVLAPKTNRKVRFSRLGFDNHINALQKEHTKEKEIVSTLDRIRKQREERKKERER